MFCLAEGYGVLRNVPYFWGNKKRIWSAGACWESERSLWSWQMAAVVKPSKYGIAGFPLPFVRLFVLNRGGLQRSICFVFVFLKSERSLSHGTKNEWSVIATLQKSEGGPWHTQGFHIAAFGAGTIIFMPGMETGQYGAIRGHGGG